MLLKAMISKLGLELMEEHQRPNQHIQTIKVTGIEEAIEQCGGVGRFQYKSFTVIVMGMLAGAFFLYSLPYFEKQPQLQCKSTSSQTDWVDCTQSVACNPSLTYVYRADPDAVDTMNNWVTQMDLYCTNEFDMGLIGSSFLAGCFAGSFILPRLADIVGRRTIYIVGLLLFISVVGASLFCKDLIFAYGLLFFGGISETGRYYVAYVYCVEFWPKKVQDQTGLYIFFVFGITMTLIAQLFWWVYKDWQYNAYIALTLAITSLILTLVWLPESVRFLYGKQQFEAVNKVLKKINAVNNPGTIEKVFEFNITNRTDFQTLNNPEQTKHDETDDDI